jgi:hypothetical protein
VLAPVGAFSLSYAAVDYAGLGLDVASCLGTVASVMGLVISWKVLRRVSRIQTQIHLRSALEDHKKQLKGCEKNVRQALQNGRTPASGDVGKINALAADLNQKANAARIDSELMANLADASKMLCDACVGWNGARPQLERIHEALTKVVIFIDCAVRDYNWSIK